MSNNPDNNAAAAAASAVVLATGGYDHSIRFWEAPTGLCHRSLSYADSQINQLEITSDKQYLAVGGNPSIRLYDLVSSAAQPVVSLDGHTNNVTAIGFQRDRRWMYSSSEDSSLKIWDVRSAGFQRDYTIGCAINTAILHPNQAEIITGDEDGNIKVFDLAANKCIFTHTTANMTQQHTINPKTPIRSLAIAADATILIASNNKGVVIVFRINVNANVNAQPQSNSNGETKTEAADNGANDNGSTTNSHPASPPYLEVLQHIDAHSTYCLKALLSPDVHMLATASADKTIKLWNVNLNDSAAANGTADAQHSTADSQTKAHKSSNGSLRSSVLTYDKSLTGHTGWVWDLSFSADSAYLVSVSSDKLAKLWDVKSSEVILEYRGHQKAITAVALNDSSIVE